MVFIISSLINNYHIRPDVFTSGDNILIAAEPHIININYIDYLATDGDLFVYKDGLDVGYKNFELKNHLGNVLATVSDLKLSDQTAMMNSGTDYLPFGMQMPGRHYSDATGYRYGFNGKENDNEIKGEGNSVDFGARMYDSRLGRWFATDPLAGKYPYLSPYNFVANSPLVFVDPDGRDIWFVVFDVDGNSKYVNFSDLDKLAQESILNYLCTKSGYEFTAQFAKKGDEIGGVVFHNDGIYSDQVYRFAIDKDGYNASGLTSYFFETDIKGENYLVLQNYLNLEYQEDAVDGAITVGHESFLHAQKRIAELIGLIWNGGTKEDFEKLNKILNEKRGLGGWKDHQDFIDNKESSDAFYNYLKELKEQVDENLVEKHLKLDKIVIKNDIRETKEEERRKKAREARKTRKAK